MLSSRYFLFSLLLSFAFAIANFIQNVYYYLNNMNRFSVFEKWMGATTETFGALSFYYVFPILASLPFAWTLCDELHSGYALQVFTRTGKKEYFMGKLVSSFLSGGIVISSTLTLDILLLTALSPTYRPTPNDMISGIISGNFCSELYYTHPVIFTVIWICVEFLWGGVIAVLCSSLGLFIKRKGLLLPSMMLIWIGESVLASFIDLKRNEYSIEFRWMYLTQADPLTINPAWAIFGSIGLILLVGCLISWIKGARYEAL